METIVTLYACHLNRASVSLASLLGANTAIAWLLHFAWLFHTQAGYDFAELIQIESCGPRIPVAKYPNCQLSWTLLSLLIIMTESSSAYDPGFALPVEQLYCPGGHLFMVAKSTVSLARIMRISMAKWRLPIVISICAVSSIPLKAQDYPKSELFGGYRVSVDDHVFGGLSSVDSTLHGLAAAAEFNLHSSLGIVAELGYGRSQHEFSFSDTAYNRSQTTLLGGPRLSLRGKRTRGFGHALVGICHEATDSPPGLFEMPNQNPQRVSTNNFAIVLGGGLDISLGNVISIRPVQLDFIYTKHESYAGASHSLSEVRYMGGIVIKIGVGPR